LPNVGPYIYDVSISGFTRSSIYIYDISSLRVKMDLTETRREHNSTVWERCPVVGSLRTIIPKHWFLYAEPLTSQPNTIGLKYSVPQTRHVNFVRWYTRVRISLYSDFCDVHNFSKRFVTIYDDVMLQFVSLGFLDFVQSRFPITRGPKFRKFPAMLTVTLTHVWTMKRRNTSLLAIRNSRNAIKTSRHY